MSVDTWLTVLIGLSRCVVLRTDTRGHTAMTRRLTALSTVVLLAVFLSVAVLRTAHAAAGCRVSYLVTYETDEFFGGRVDLTNLGDPVTSWQLTWTFTGGQQITQGFYGVFSQTGAAVTVDNESWNGAVATGDTVNLWFNAVRTDANPPPDDFSFNGTACDVVLPTPTVSPTGPTPPLDPVGQVLEVDLASGGFNPVRRVAAGGVHALNYPDQPTDASLRPLRLNTIVQHAPHGGPLSPADPLLISPQVDRAGIGQYVRMLETQAGTVKPFTGWNSWLSYVDQMVGTRLNAMRVSNVVGWEIWNQPDRNWDDMVGSTPFMQGWTMIYRQIRYRDTATPIVGPSLSRWDPTFMYSFLADARLNGVLPQIVSWYEIDGTPARIAANVRTYRQMEAALGIAPRPISIMGYGNAAEAQSPGRMASYIAKLERARVAAAQRAYWGHPGTVDGLVVSPGQHTATWWLHKWYADLAGKMIDTRPPAQTGLDGFASYDGTRQLVQVVVGDQTDTNSVRLRHLDMGDTVRVTVEATAPGGYSPVDPPSVVSDKAYQVVDGELVVHIPDMQSSRAYRVLVQPEGGAPSFQRRYEAENASLFRATPMPSLQASNGGYVGGITVGPDPRFGSYLDFVVEVPASRYYLLRLAYYNATGTSARQGLSVNSDPYRVIDYPPTGSGGFGSVTISLPLNAGYSVIRLAKCAANINNESSPGCPATAGSVDLDYLELQ